MPMGTHFIREWGGEGNGPGQFKEPWGVAVAPNGDVYALDTWNHRIQVYSEQGVLKRTWGVFGQVQEPSGPGNVFYGPRDIIFDDEGSFYVVDTGNKRVVKYDPEGRMVGATGGPSDMPFQEPVGIALGKDGTVYVADTWNQQIQVFDKDLVFLRRWPVVAWDGTSVVNKPYLAVDQTGNVYATDPEGYRVFKFDDHGKLLQVWGQYGTDRSSMNLPTGIKIDHTGRILITDSENHRILVLGGDR